MQDTRCTCWDTLILECTGVWETLLFQDVGQGEGHSVRARPITAGSQDTITTQSKTRPTISTKYDSHRGAIHCEHGRHRDMVVRKTLIFRAAAQDTERRGPTEGRARIGLPRTTCCSHHAPGGTGPESPQHLTQSPPALPPAPACLSPLRRSYPLSLLFLWAFLILIFLHILLILTYTVHYLLLF